MRVTLLLSLLSIVSGQQEKDLVTNLPGLTFQTNFNTYSGYLNANQNGSWQMHYFLTESKSDPDNDPLLLWFNGGPGCSSYGGMFEELGPFYNNYDGDSLYENVYSWNAKANVLALESPIGVGFSYDTNNPNYTMASDDQTMEQNYAALKDFFLRVQPKYGNRSFFLSGESYAGTITGIYIPMLSQKLVEGINSGDFPNKNFQGAAIGNGFMHVQHLMNSLVIWSAYHGIISQDDWDRTKLLCQTGSETDHDKYNYQQYMTSTNGMDYYANLSTQCGQLIAPLISQDGWNGTSFDPYNYYQDCYVLNSAGTGTQNSLKRRQRLNFGGTKNLNPNTAKLYNFDSTDNQWGYPCWNDVALKKWSNRRDVQDALHIPDAFRNQQADGQFQWRDCNDPMYDAYTLTYNNMQDRFTYVLNNVQTPNFRFLIYNGDVDTVCNYLGDSWFIRDVQRANNMAVGNRVGWGFGQQMAGYVQTYTSTYSNPVTIDVLTVKGAGHFVPGDRPGPSVQMITNFMFPTASGVDYSSTANVNNPPVLSPLLSTTTTTATTTTAVPTTVTVTKGTTTMNSLNLLALFMTLLCSHRYL